MAESGLPDVTTVTYYGIMGPARMPADVVIKLNNAANDSLRSPELTASMEKLGSVRKAEHRRIRRAAQRADAEMGAGR